MKRLTENISHGMLIVCVACFATLSDAQDLWKYTDKSGKVTYSDKAPKDGEQAVRVITDTTGTVLPAAKNLYDGQPQGSAAVSSRAAQREATRDSYRKNVDTARDELAAAKKALESGREATQEERQIVVGRGKDGQPTGANSVIRKPEYDERIAGLEAAIKKAEEKVANAEKNARENAPK